MVGPKVVARIEEAHRSPSYSVRHPFTLPPVAVRTGPGVIVEFRPGCVGTPSKRPWTYSPHRFAGIICSIWKVLVVGSKQYSQASWARRRTTARTSRLSGLWTGRRRRAAMRRSSPGWSIKACALAEQPGLAQSMRSLGSPVFTGLLDERLQACRIGFELPSPRDHPLEVRGHLDAYLIDR